MSDYILIDSRASLCLDDKTEKKTQNSFPSVLVLLHEMAPTAELPTFVRPLPQAAPQQWPIV